MRLTGCRMLAVLRLVVLVLGFVAGVRATVPAERTVTLLWNSETRPVPFTVFSGQTVKLRFLVSGVLGEAVRLRADPFQKTRAMAVPLAPILNFASLAAIRKESPNVVVGEWKAPKLEKPATFLLRITRDDVTPGTPVVLTIQVVPDSPLRDLSGVAPAWVVRRTAEFLPLANALTSAKLQVVSEPVAPTGKGIPFIRDKNGQTSTVKRIVVFSSILKEPSSSRVLVFEGGWRIMLPDCLLHGLDSNADYQQALSEGILTAEQLTRNPP